MVQEGTPAIFVTFLLAVVGYFGLAAVVWVMTARTARGVPVLLWRAVSAVILIHLLMVWAFRYGWQPALAVRNGYTGFLIFHGAVLAILVSHMVPPRLAMGLIQASFLVVSAGSIGAAFRYEAVGLYKYPVLLCAAAGLARLGWYHMRGRSLSETAESPTSSGFMEKGSEKR